jgi:hypothetical protein
LVQGIGNRRSDTMIGEHSEVDDSRCEQYLYKHASRHAMPHKTHYNVGLYILSTHKPNWLVKKLKIL